MLPRFFIERPVFAWVLAILLSLAGLISIAKIPVEQYPKIAPPSVAISANMPGASSETLENTVTQIIEQNLTGIDNLRYFSSSSSSDGSVNINLTFEPNINPDIAQVQVQNKVQSILPLLPGAVRDLGVSVTKSNTTFLMVAAVYLEDEAPDYSTGELSDIVNSRLKEPVSRVNGVGSVRVFGGQNSMRIWLKPERLFSYKLTPLDVTAAISAQNVSIAAGQLGGLPSQKGQQLNATITAASLLQTPDEFEQIILRSNLDGSTVLLKDVARIEVAPENYSTIIRYNKKIASGMGITLATGANALKTGKDVKEVLNKLATTLPEGMKLVYTYDTTPFIKISIMKVVHTLIEAFILVFIIIFIFLQNFRATFIPSISIPIIILGTFAVLNALGYSINTLTMFALVLAIGLLVDDSIVVVENVERIMREEGLSPIEATKKSMDQIQGALIGISMVLSAVFIPMAFFSGSAGNIYRQFSITIVTSMGLSVLVSLILAPALCISILKPNNHKPTWRGFQYFNHFLQSLQNIYIIGASSILKKIIRYIIIYLLVCLGIAFFFKRMPTSFLPNEDQGILFALLNTPPSSTLEYTLENVKQMENYLLEAESKNIEHLFTITGYSFSGVAQNTALSFIMLKDFDKRKLKDQSSFSIAGRANGFFFTLKNAMAFMIVPPPVRELGNSTGFEMQLIDESGVGRETLLNSRDQLLMEAGKSRLLMGVRPNGLNNVPQYSLNVDSTRASSYGLQIPDINRNLSIIWASSYINDYLDKGRTKKVIVQGESNARMVPEDMEKWFVRNNKGDMVSIGSFTSGSWKYGAPSLERFNGVSSYNIQGGPRPGLSSGVAIKEMQRIVSLLPKGISMAWSGLSYEEKATRGEIPFLYTISILIVFLSLAALYESWSIPFSVLFVLPFGVFGSLCASSLFRMNNDIYLQVALLTTIGLSAKNAILIVEFAKKLYEEGHDLVEANIIALKQRFRPILMTSMAFCLGVLPLAIARGASSASQNALGIAIIGGMVTATFVTPLFVPLFYILTQKKRTV